MISRLHVVTNDLILGAADFLSAAGEVLESGSGGLTFHLRGPGTRARTLWELAVALRPIARDRNVPIMVNDRVDLALAMQADGVHLGVRSLPIAATRRLLGPSGRVGCSVHSRAEAEEICSPEPDSLNQPDFLLAGAIFATQSHVDRASAGPGLLRVVKGVLPSVPVLGIGGITLARIPEIVDAGAYGVAVIRAVWDAPEPGVAVTQLLLGLDHAVPSSAT